MSIADKILTCRDCHKPFVWTVGEQNFFRAKGLQNIPARCDTCRDIRRRKDPHEPTTGAKNSSVRTKVVCAECGLETVVPFLPRTGKPIFCSTCYARSKDIISTVEPPMTTVTSESEAVAVTPNAIAS